MINDALNSSKTLVSHTLGSALTTLLLIFVLPVYVFLLLFYKTLILGVEYAVLLGLLGALLNMPPKIGGITAIALPVLMATVTKNGFSTQFGIIIAYMIIQFIDNNFLVPKIVSSKVQINALVSILAVLLGGALWGIAGMFYRFLLLP